MKTLTILLLSVFASTFSALPSAAENEVHQHEKLDTHTENNVKSDHKVKINHDENASEDRESHVNHATANNKGEK